MSNELRDAARALDRGDGLRALGLVGRNDTAIGLLLRGIAYAQLGDLTLARRSLERAASILSGRDSLFHAHAEAALVEILMAEGDPARAAHAARKSAARLEQLGDTRNAAMQRLVLARAEVLLGRLGEARRVVEEVLESRSLTADVRAVASLASAEIAIRDVAATTARHALTRARAALADAPNELLARAIVNLERDLTMPVARMERRGVIRDADLFAVEEASTRGDVFFVDACRRVTIAGRVTIAFTKRPILFALLVALARAWPSSIARDLLVTNVFDAKRPNESHRARLRVEMGRLRKLLEGVASAVATEDGYVLEPGAEREVAVLLSPSDDEHRIALLLRDGAMWSAQALAEHAGASKRTVQRALSDSVARGDVIRTGKAKDVRYARPGTPIASRMLLLGLVPKS